jgi:cytochrome c oxidase subunit 1
MNTTSPSFIRRYIFSTDHKVVAIQYLLNGLFFLGFGGLMAVLIRWQVAHPWQPVPFIGKWLFPDSGGAITPEIYTMLFTNHGTIMVFFAITPILIGAFGNYLIPLEVGARDMAFPTVNMLSYWFLFLGSVVLLASFFMSGGASGGGWTVYPPLSSSIRVTPGWGQDLFILALALDAVSILMGGINYITTLFQLRAPGMNLRRLPLTLWGLFYSSVLNTLWLPLVAAALFMVLTDRRLGTSFFTAGPLAPHEGGQVLLYQHLFWGFGHPEVYILILPVWGMVADFLSIFSRKPAFGYTATVISMLCVSTLSGIVWGHHMFTAGMNPLVGKVFMLLTVTVSVPTAVFFLNWLATIWRGSLRFPTPMLFTLGVVFVFTIGGLTGLFNAMQAFDVYIHDTYFVVGHFHFTLSASVFLGVFALIYFWFPKMFGKKMNETAGKIHFWASFLSMNVLFTFMMISGLHGHMRRLADPSIYDFLKPIQWMQPILWWSAFALGVSQLIFVVNFVGSLIWGQKAEENPWQAGSLAWTTSSPPPAHNYDITPVVTCGPHEFGVPGLKDRDWMLQNDPRGATLGRS